MLGSTQLNKIHKQYLYLNAIKQYDHYHFLKLYKKLLLKKNTMKYLTLTFTIISILLASCGGSDKSTVSSTSDTAQLAKSTDKPIAATTVNNPAIEAEVMSNQIVLTANDRLQYSDTLFKIKAGQVVTLKLTNIGKMPKNSMGHNFVLLNTGTDITNFAGEAMKAMQSDYIPASLKTAVIAHTKLVGPGESDEITFTIKDKGYYDFICSFPGHYGSMRGKIIAE
jgi:azurin